MVEQLHGQLKSMFLYLSSNGLKVRTLEKECVRLLLLAVYSSTSAKITTSMNHTNILKFPMKLIQPLIPLMCLGMKLATISSQNMTVENVQVLSEVYGC